MVNPLPLIIFTLLAVAGFFALGPSETNPAMIVAYVVWLLASMVVASSLRMAAQWEKALVFRLGRFSSVKGPGIFTVPGLMKCTVRNKPAVPAGRRMDPFTKQMRDFPAKPASRVVNIRPLKNMKEMVK